MITTKISVTTLSALILFGSCQKEISLKPEVSMENLTFSGLYDGGANLTKASAVFTPGNKVTILGFPPSKTDSPLVGTPLDATGIVGGSLNPTTALYLPKGSYDFYSISANNSNSPGIAFNSSGISGALSNNIDYLWAKSSTISVNGATNIPFTFFHKAVGIEIVLSSGVGVSNLSAISIKLTPSTSGATMTLSSGIIAPANSVDILTPMALTGNTGKYIMLPLAPAKTINLELKVNATIGGVAVSNKVYTATIPAQSEGFQSGNYYKLNLTVSATALTFTGATVEDWVSQSISGITLTEE